MGRVAVVREGSQHTQERLLGALADLLATRDTMEFSLAEVAQRAGLNHALVGYHFGGKTGLLIALLKRAATTALASLERLVEADLAGLAKIELHVRGVIGVYFRHPYINRLINHLQCGSEENARELATIFIRPLRGYQAALLAQARREGAIRAIDPGLFYVSVIGACDFLFQSRRTLPHVLDAETCDATLRDRYADHLVALIVDGMRVPDRAAYPEAA